MYSKVITPLVLITVLFSFAAFTIAPNSDVDVMEGTLSGYVWDATTETPLSGVEVRVDGQEATATSDEEGYFSFDHLEAGEHTVTVEHDMYETYETTVTINDEPVNLNILLYRSE